jgi:hypothetical protein
MENLKIIPQVFFDLIARVVPGSVGIIAYLILFGKDWTDTITKIFGQSFSVESTTLSFLIYLGTGYVIGELISPLAKMVQRINELKIPNSISAFKKMVAKKEKNKEVKEIENEMNKKLKSEDKKFSEDKIRYDRLRLKHPDVGALCAKIRAEFTMHNELAVVFFISALYYPFSVLQFNWYAFYFLLFMSFISAYRGRNTNITFKETVAKFTQILNEQGSGIENKSMKN